MIWKKKKQKQVQVTLTALQQRLIGQLVASLGNYMLDEDARHYIFFSAHGGKAPRKITILEKK